MDEVEEILRFIQFVEKEIDPKVHPPEGDALKLAAHSILKKSTMTLKAICDLCSQGYGEDAQILGRTIFENALTLTYICKPDSNEDRDCIAKLYILHTAKEQQNKHKTIEELKRKGKCKKWIEGLEKGKDSLDLEKEEGLLKKALEEHDKYRVRYTQYLKKIGKRSHKTSNWSLISLKNMCEVVGEPYECYYHFVYWIISNLVHPSPLGSSSYYGVSRPPGEFGEIGRAITISSACYHRIVDMVNGIFGVHTELDNSLL